MSRKGQIGDEGTEQFRITTSLNNEQIRTTAIHDPFATTVITTVLSRWEAFKGIFKKRVLQYQVSLDGSEGAIRAIMMLDPVALAEETAEILEERRQSRERNGYYEGLVAQANAQPKGDE